MAVDLKSRAKRRFAGRCGSSVDISRSCKAPSHGALEALRWARGEKARPRYASADVLSPEAFSAAVAKALKEWDQGGDLSALDDIRLLCSDEQYAAAVRIIKRHGDALRDREVHRSVARELRPSAPYDERPPA